LTKEHLIAVHLVAAHLIDSPQNGQGFVVSCSLLTIASKVKDMWIALTAACPRLL